MGLLDVLGASRAVCEGVAGIETAYRTNPGREVEPAKIPATLQEPGPVEIAWSNSQDDRRYEFSIHLFYHREGKTVDEEVAAVGLAEDITEAFKTVPNDARLLGIIDMRPIAMSKPFPWSINEKSYTVVTLTMSAKQKVAATFS